MIRCLITGMVMFALASTHAQATTWAGPPNWGPWRAFHVFEDIILLDCHVDALRAREQVECSIVVSWKRRVTGKETIEPLRDMAMVGDGGERDLLLIDSMPKERAMGEYPRAFDRHGVHVVQLVPRESVPLVMEYVSGRSDAVGLSTEEARGRAYWAAMRRWIASEDLVIVALLRQDLGPLAFGMWLPDPEWWVDRLLREERGDVRDLIERAVSSVVKAEPTAANVVAFSRWLEADGERARAFLQAVARGWRSVKSDALHEMIQRMAADERPERAELRALAQSAIEATDARRQPRR